MGQLKQIFKNFLRTTFDIREGEYRRVFLLQLNIFLIIVTLLIIKPVATAQFISTIGVEHLPFVFVLVAICALGISILYARALNKNSLQRVTFLTLLISVISLVVLGILLRHGGSQKTVLYVLYIGVANFGVLTTSQFWIMTNLVFNAREAKRLFSFIGAGPIAGGVVGGYITSILANFLEPSHLLFVSAGILCICIPLNKAIWTRHIKPLTDIQKGRRLKGFGDHPLSIIRKSRHLSYLALVVGIGVVVSKLVDFQFSTIALDNFPDPDNLTAFFGFWFSTFNIVSLIIQLFITRRIVGTFGVGSSLFALPGGVLLGSTLLLFFPLLWAGIFTKMWEVSVKQSVNKAATELLILPIPSGIKSQAKSFIDVFVDMAATGVGGILLIILINWLDLNIEAVSILTIIIVLIWGWIALKLRKQYIQSFKAKLTQADKKAAISQTNINDVSVVEGLKRALDSGSEKQVLYVLKKVREISDQRLFENVSKHLFSDSDQVRLAALDCVYFLKYHVPDQPMQLLLRDANYNIRFQAFAQLIQQTPLDRVQAIASYLEENDEQIRGAALVGILSETRNNVEMSRQLKLTQYVEQWVERHNRPGESTDQTFNDIVTLRCIAYANAQHHYPVIVSAMNGGNADISREAIHAAGLSLDVYFIDQLVTKLAAKETRAVATEALLGYGKGLINELKKPLAKPNVDPDQFADIPKILEKISDQQSANLLMSFLKLNDVRLRLESLRSLNAMTRDYPHLKIKKDDILDQIVEEASVYKHILGILYVQNQKLNAENPPAIDEARTQLIELLERRLDGTLERIFRLLGLRYPPEDVIPVYAGIKSINPNVRLNSVEFLDNILESNLKKTLVPIAESAILENLSKDTIDHLKVPLFDEKAFLTMLLDGHDPKLKMAVIKLIEAKGEKKYLDLLVPLTNSTNVKIRNRVRSVLQNSAN